MQKRISDIKRKVRTLKKRLENKEICENFGDKEIQELKDYVGDVWSYPYSERLQIIKIIDDFEEWCYNFLNKQQNY